MTDLTRLSAATLADLLAAREVSSVDVTRAHLDRIESVDADVHAFLHVAADNAVRTAAEIDGRRRFRGEVVEAGERAFTVRTADETAFTIPYEAIVRSNLIDEG